MESTKNMQWGSCGGQNGHLWILPLGEHLVFGTACRCGKAQWNGTGKPPTIIDEDRIAKLEQRINYLFQHLGLRG